MKLSDDQTLVVMHGLGSQKSWVDVPLPSGHLELPKWLLDCHIDMMMGWGNPPRALYHVKGEPWPDGEPQIFEREEGEYWRARSSDGWSMLQHIHGGEVRPATVWRVTGLDSNTHASKSETDWIITDPKKGESQMTAAMGAAMEHLKLCVKHGSPEAQIETKDAHVTTKLDGYGGRVFWINTKTHGEVALRGPFFGGTPLGWHEAICYSRDDSPYEIQQDRRGIPWYKRSGTFGYYVSEELLLRAVATFQPHLRMARVYPGYGQARLEPYEAAWGCPKEFR